MNYTLIYCYDAYCGWCFGFSGVIYSLWSHYRERIHVEVLSGGMILPEEPVHISATAKYISASYRRVEELSQVRFGADYLWHINNPDDSDWFPDSLKPAIALCIFKELFPDSQVAMAKELQDALFREGRDLTDDEAYRHLLEKYKISPELFFSKLHSESYIEKARYEFTLVKQLKVTGFPCLLLQVSESRFFLVSSGFTDYDTIKSRLETIFENPSV